MRSGVDAQFEAKLSFAGGIGADIRGSMVVDEPIARLLIEGEAGSIEVENPLAPQRGHALRLNVDGRTTTAVVPGPTTYEAQLSAVRGTLIDGVAFPVPPDDYIRSMAAIVAVRARLRPEPTRGASLKTRCCKLAASHDRGLHPSPMSRNLSRLTNSPTF